MAYEFKLPDLGEGLTEGEVARWLVAEGDEVAEDDPLVEIQTDKTTVEIPSPAAGPVSRILVAAGEVVPVGTVLVVIGGDGAAPPASAVAPRRAAPVGCRRRRSSAGSPRSSASTSRPSHRPVPAGESPSPTCALQPPPTARSSSVSRTTEGRREPLRGVRRQIAQHLARAHAEIPAVTFVEECDFTGVELSLLLPLVLRATRSRCASSRS